MCDFEGGELPEIVCYLTNLTDLSFSSSNRSKIDRSKINNQVSDSTAHLLSNLINLTSLDLRGIVSQNLEIIIDNLSCNLHSLFISYNSIKVLPENIGNLMNLKYLKISNNLIKVLPESIGNLMRLECLDISMNELDNLPVSFKNLTELTELDLSYNLINDLPDSIRYLTNLTKLELDSNLLTQLPNWFGCLTKITELKLAVNEIVELPDSIKYLTKLTELDLDGNPLTDLSILQSLPALKTVRMFDLELPRRYWTKFSDWNPEWLLDEENAEIRKTLIEQVGYEKICDKLGAISIDSWREYQLIKIQADVDLEPIFLLKMTCPSTHHIHVLRVPPTMISAEAAITWINHGIHPDDFTVQT